MPLVVLGLVALPARAFDTGYHLDLTAAVLGEHGFGEVPLKAVCVANWLTDYYAVSPTSRDVVEAELAKLHFDNLYGTSQAAAVWGRLVANGERALREAAAGEDATDALTILGVFLHAAQDFYAHSNWVETHPRDPDGPFRRETWLAHGPPPGVEIVSGSYPPSPSPPPPGHPEHGDYETGLNKDSHIRPGWEEAYVFAYAASHEIVGLARAWVESERPGFWDRLRRLQIEEKERRQLDFDMEAARKMSLWVKGEGADGHWKGNESGSVRYLSKFSAEWTMDRASVFVRQIKRHRVHERLAEGLYSDEPAPPLPRVAPFAGERRAVLVRLTHVEEKRDGGRRIDPGGRADLFAVVDVGPQRYRDRTLRSKKVYDDPWTVLHLAAGEETEIPIRIEVWDEDGGIHGDADLCDVSPVRGSYRLDLTLTPGEDLVSGDLEGRFDEAERAFESSGAKPDRNRILLRGTLSTTELEASLRSGS